MRCKVQRACRIWSVEFGSSREDRYEILILGYYRCDLLRNVLKWTAAQIKAELNEVYRNSAPALKTIYFRINEFKRGRTCTEDEAHSGRSVEITTLDIVKKIHGMIMENRRMKVREIAEAVGISTERVHNILHEKLHVKKLLLASIRVDETWIHHYTPETKQQSKQWIMSGESAPKKAKTVLSAGKMMATVFWDSQGIILIDYLQKDKTITGEYYATLLNHLKEELKKKRPRLARKKVLFQDNAPFHKSTVAMTKLHELGYELIPHPPYSPDLAPCDFFLFLNLKTWLGGKKFSSNEEVIEYFADFETAYFSDGIKKLETRWTKCIALDGDYVEK
ncbi:PREDICTED: histone-lysine N-methyltransferase SETMAR-like [Atta cephalotes]|uniref:Mos1 transposase HTH domain-containing protein n=1 Tax=Atta cephalotes TaxID=12957 RepID=A0A158P1L3_ATTCE|nr:PREDICTED: histone-lysine N-methyltransferase SETMAR-like [Atta cephalotes]